MVQTETSLGITSQARDSVSCRMELCYSYTLDYQMRTPPVNGHKSWTTFNHNLQNSWHCHKLHAWNKQRMTTCMRWQYLSLPLAAFECTKEHQDPSLLPLAHPDMQHPFHFTNAGSLGQKLASDNATLGSSSLGQDEPGTCTVCWPPAWTLQAWLHWWQKFTSPNVQPTL